MKKMEFKIVKILDEYNIVINAGISHNIEQGDRFQILDKESSVVKDPDTNVVIGTLDLIKATLIVTELHDNMCICSSESTINKNMLKSDINAISNNFNFSFSEQERLNVDLSQVTGGKRKSNKKIQLGDTARLLNSKV